MEYLLSLISPKLIAVYSLLKIFSTSIVLKENTLNANGKLHKFVKNKRAELFSYTDSVKVLSINFQKMIPQEF